MCDLLPLLSPTQQTLHVDSSGVPTPRFLLFRCVCSSRQMVVLHRRVSPWPWGCCRRRAPQYCSAPLYPSGAGDKTGCSGTLHIPAEKKDFAPTCFLLTPETRISQILNYYPFFFLFFFHTQPTFPSSDLTSAPTDGSPPPSSCHPLSDTHVAHS